MAKHEYVLNAKLGNTNYNFYTNNCNLTNGKSRGDGVLCAVKKKIYCRSLNYTGFFFF